MSWSHRHHVIVELPPLSWSCRRNCGAVTIVVEPLPLYDKEEEDQDKEEKEEDKEKEKEVIIALTLQHAQRICYISTVTM